MGVDTSIKIRMLDESNVSKMEIEVSPQDNSLASILDGGSNQIRYLSVSLDDEKFLSPEELEKIRLREDEEDDILMMSDIINSKEALRFFDKIDRFTHQRLRNALEADLSQINESDADDENKARRRKDQIGEYIGFEYSLGVAIGVLKLAAALYPNVQIVGEYY